MIIQSIAPSRVSLFGGGTDVDSYALNYGGRTISFAINLRQEITFYADSDILFANHSIPFDANPLLYQSILKEYELGMHEAIVSSRFDGVIGAGLGSSASFAVCLLGAIAKYKGWSSTPRSLAEVAYLHEQKLGWYGGRQDQYASAYGGFNIFEYGKKGVEKAFEFDKNTIEPLMPSFVLFYTGGTRTSAKIQKGFQKLTQKQIKTLHAIKKLTVTAENFIKVGNIKELGLLLDEAWQLKKESNNGVSNPLIDDIYQDALKLGAYGGKLLGAGGCGYMFFIIDPRKRQHFIDNMIGLEVVDFSVDWNGVEARIL